MSQPIRRVLQLPSRLDRRGVRSGDGARPSARHGRREDLRDRGRSECAAASLRRSSRRAHRDLLAADHGHHQHGRDRRALHCSEHLLSPERLRSPGRFLQRDGGRFKSRPCGGHPHRLRVCAPAAAPDDDRDPRGAGAADRQHDAAAAGGGGDGAAGAGRGRPQARRSGGGDGAAEGGDARAPAAHARRRRRRSAASRSCPLCRRGPAGQPRRADPARPSGRRGRPDPPRRQRPAAPSLPGAPSEPSLPAAPSRTGTTAADSALPAPTSLVAVATQLRRRARSSVVTT